MSLKEGNNRKGFLERYQELRRENQTLRRKARIVLPLLFFAGAAGMLLVNYFARESAVPNKIYTQVATDEDCHNEPPRFDADYKLDYYLSTDYMVDDKRVCVWKPSRFNR